MRSRLTQFITLLLLAAILVAPSLGNAFYGCDEGQDLSIPVFEIDLKSSLKSFAGSNTGHQEKKPTSPHGEDCNCPIHRTGCYHVAAYISHEQGTVLAMRLATKKFSEINTSVKPGPFLEGPFQPPRA